MVVNFEVGKTYRYNGKIGDPSPFIAIGIAEQDALFIVSGKPLVCTYAEKGYCPDVGFKGMNHENDGWAFISLYDLFDEVKETTVAKEKQKEKQKEEKKEMPKFEVGKKYRYTGSSGSAIDFVQIGINREDAEYIVSGEPMTVEYVYLGYRIKFKEFVNRWSFLSTMLEKFEEVPATDVPYAERQAKWVKDNNIVRGSKVRLLRSYEPNEEGYVTEYPYAGKKVKKHPVGEVFRVCYEDSYMGMVLAPTYDDFESDVGNYFPYFVLEKVADDTPVYGEQIISLKKDYVARQTEWAKENNVKVGTKVRVTRTAEDNEDGWDNGWVSAMDKNVGKTGTVEWGIETSYGLSIDFGEGEDRAKYGYPFFVLEVVKDTSVSKDTYVPVKKFETGKWYVCHLKERPWVWNRDGKMDGLLDGKPHKCSMGNNTEASFEDIPLQCGGGWCFHSTIEYFEEVPAPSSEVDWEKKYAELEKRYHKLKEVAVEYMGQLSAESDGYKTILEVM